MIHIRIKNIFRVILVCLGECGFVFVWFSLSFFLCLIFSMLEHKITQWLHVSFRMRLLTFMGNSQLIA